MPRSELVDIDRECGICGRVYPDRMLPPVPQYLRLGSCPDCKMRVQAHKPITSDELRRPNRVDWWEDHDH